MKEMDLLGKCEALFTAWFTGGLARGGMGWDGAEGGEGYHTAWLYHEAVYTGIVL